MILAIFIIFGLCLGLWAIAGGILNDGFNTTITFSQAGVLFKEMEVTPPAIDGGGEINVTSMRNTYWRTKSPKYLVTLDKMSLKVQYNPTLYGPARIALLVNWNQQTTLNFPTLAVLGLVPATATTVTFFGWLNKFAPEALKDGDLPLADIEIIPSMLNTSGVETPPVVVN